MKSLTEKQRQWAWFAGLWFGGLGAMLLLAYAVRSMLFGF
jgi:hypothetical protein